MFEHLRFHILSAVVALFLSPAIAHADMGGIRDDGAFFSAQAKTDALKEIHEIGNRFKKDLVFETFREIPADLKQGVDLTDRAAMGRLYEQWATKQAKQQKVNGIYVLLVKDPSHMQILVGNDTQKVAFTLKDRDAMVTMMLAKLRSKQNDDALREGVNYVNATLRSHLPERGLVPANRSNVQGHTPPLVRGSNTVHTTNQGSSNWIWILLIAVIGLWVVLRILGSMFSRSGGGGGGGYQGGAYQGGGMAPGGGGGGFMSSMLGGMFGAAGGMWLYDKFSGHSSQQWGGGDGGYSGQNLGDSGQDSGYSGQDTDYSGSGGDFGGGDSGGGDSGGGGDFGGGGDSGGGDF